MYEKFAELLDKTNKTAYQVSKDTGIGWQFDGHWGGDVSGTKARCIAWQPLPEPYRRFKKELS